MNEIFLYVHRLVSRCSVRPILVICEQCFTSYKYNKISPLLGRRIMPENESSAACASAKRCQYELSPNIYNLFSCSNSQSSFLLIVIFQWLKRVPYANLGKKISIIHEEQKWFLKRNARDQGLLVLRDQLLKNNIEAVNRQRHAYRDT